jgi:hypothetical protein
MTETPARPQSAEQEWEKNIHQQLDTFGVLRLAQSELSRLRAERDGLRESLHDWDTYAGVALANYWEQLQYWKNQEAAYAEGLLVERDYGLVERLVKAMAALAALPDPPEGETR